MPSAIPRHPIRADLFTPSRRRMLSLDLPSSTTNSPAAHGRKRLTFVLQSLLLLSLLLISSVFIAPMAFAFANGQNASVVIGQPNFTSKASILPQVNQSRLNTPYDVKFDSSGNMWVVDSADSRVLEFQPPFTNGESASLVLGESSFTTSYLAGSTALNGTVLSDPEYITFDSHGNLWVSDTGDARVVEFTAPFSTGENASLVLGAPDLRTPGDESQTASQTDLSNPAGLAFDSAGNLWVSDPGYDRVVEFAAPLTNGESESVVLGQDNFTAKSFPNEPDCPPTCNTPTASTLNNPFDVAFDSAGNMWVADRSDWRVVEFTQPFSNGQAASTIVGGPCNIFGEVLTSGCIGVTEGIGFDHSGNLWVSDTANGRLLSFPAPISTGENATIVLGEPDFATTYGVVVNATQSNLVGPEGFAFDLSGNVWVSDFAFNRVLEFSSSTTGPATTTTSSTVQGSTTTTTTSTTPTQQTTAVTTTPSQTQQTTSTASTSTGGGGGIPEFPTSAVAVTTITVLVVASYLLARRRATSKVPGGATVPPAL
jgi:sugar lactone lactonase YvrE